MDIGYKYNSSKVLGFIGTKVDGSTEPSYPYLSRFTDIYSNVSVRPVVRPNLLGRYFNACNWAPPGDCAMCERGGAEAEAAGRDGDEGELGVGISRILTTNGGGFGVLVPRAASDGF